MSRGRTALIAAAALVGLALVASLLPVPYVVFSPGPTADVLGDVDGEPVIDASGAPTYDVDGQLDLTTVGVTPAAGDVGIVDALVAWVDPDRAVIPRDAVYPEGTSADEVREVNAALWAGSQDAATAAALRYLGYEVTESVNPVVTQVFPDSPADGVLRTGDVVLAVDGEPVSGSDDVVATVSARDPGDDVDVRVDRDGKRSTRTITTEDSQTEPGTAVIGVGISDVVTDFEAPVEVTINGPGDIGGSSAGLIFALGIIDRLTEADLLGGRHAAGTGEVSSDGSVGRISGIAQKITAAADGGAEVFLAPQSNCADIEGFEPPIPVLPVESLDEAVEILDRWVESGDVPDERCALAEAS